MAKMEVYSAQKRARSGVTLAATAVLLVIALLQSFSMVHQKGRAWAALLDARVQIDDHLSLKVPQRWRGGSEEGSREMWFRGPLDAGGPECELQVQRLPPGRIGSPREAYAYARDSMLKVSAPSPLQGSIGRSCLLGDQPATMHAFHMLSSQGQAHSVTVLAAVHETYGTTILLLIASGARNAGVDGLLRQIASSAEFK